MTSTWSAPVAASTVSMNVLTERRGSRHRADAAQPVVDAVDAASGRLQRRDQRPEVRRHRREGAVQQYNRSGVGRAVRVVDPGEADRSQDGGSGRVNRRRADRGRGRDAGRAFG